MHRTRTSPFWICLILVSALGLILRIAPSLEAQEIYDSQKETIPKMTPKEVVETVRLPEGFSITAAASEPNVQQPIAMAWDPSGRLWIAENYTYAESAKKVDATLSDRIVILEDADNDGVFEKRKVFAEGLQGLTSIEIGGSSNRGVWALAPPHLLYLKDTNLDDVADSEPQVVLSGFNADIRHNFANGLRFGPDGWLYGRHGILGSSEVYAPGPPLPPGALPTGALPPGALPPPAVPTAIPIPRAIAIPPVKTKLTCGIWRYEPASQRVEMVCEGTTNPWGMDWDDHGNLFFINTVIGHLWHAIPNAHLQRMYGEDSDPYVYELLPQIADHVHWDQSAEDWRETRKGPPSSRTDAAGGGHAHSGLMIYQADQWPKEYHGNVYALNLHGRRINRDFINPSGAGFLATHGPDMVFWQDPWFRGLDLTQSPDGSAMVIDWSDIGECHDDDGVHRTSGRIYKVSYNNPDQVPYIDLLKTLSGLYRADRTKQPTVTGQDVVSIVSHPNVWFTQQFFKHYTLNGFASPVKDPGPLVHMAINAPKDFRSQEARFEVTKQLRALWALKACKLLDNEKLLQLLKTKQHESVRSWAIRLLLDPMWKSGPIPTSNPEEREIQLEILDCLLANSRPHAHPHLRLTLASHLPKLPDVFEPIVKKLLMSEDLADDLTFSLVLWYGIKDQVVENPMEMVKSIQSSPLHKVQELVLRRLASMVTEKHPESQLASDALAFFFADAVQRDNPKLHAACIRALWGAYQGRLQVDKPAYWEQLASLASKHPDPAVVRMAVLVGSIVDRTDDPAPLLQIIAMKDVPLMERKVAVEAIGNIDTAEAIDHLERLMEDPDLGNAAAFAMRRTLSKPRAQALVERYTQASQPARAGIISALASRVDSMEVLLDAIEKKTIPQDQVDATTWRQFQSAGNWELLERARKLNKSLELSGNRQELIEKEEALLTPEAIQKGGINFGRLVWINKCGTCHKLYGEGGQIGPELTGAQRTNLRYWLENILAPSALVAENYRVTALRMQDGRVITGVVVSETPRELTVQTAQEKIVVFAAEIEQRSASQMSLMPEGLFEGLTQDQKASLLKYLMSSPQELARQKRINDPQERASQKRTDEP